MPVETHDVMFSFEQPGDARHPLLSMLQQLLNRPLARDSRAAILLGSQRVLIIDSQQERAQFIAHLLTSAGYRPFVAPTSLDAYTLFLQGTFHPFAIILSEDGPANNQFFLARLAQQFVQRYDWNVPFVRLQMPPSSSLFGPRSTEPLPRGQLAPGRPTLPLQPGDTGRTRTPSSPLMPPRTPAPRPPEQPLRLPGQRPAPPARPFQADPSLPTRTPSAPLGTPPSMSSTPPTPFPEAPAARGPVSPVPARMQGGAPLPPASPTRFGKKQVEKISLDNLSIGRYQLKSTIGGNPLGDVYLAYDRLREQDIAIKTIQTNMIPSHLIEGLEEDYNLFQPEQDLLQQNGQPHLARVMSIGKSYTSGFPFIYKVMPYYAEGSLAKWLLQFAGRHFPPAEVVRVIGQIADGVQFLHNRGMLYQNFKMTNILVVNDTQSMRKLQVVLTDLPLVQDMMNLPKAPEAYRYFAPEQWENEMFTSSDQYSLAVLTYELLTGRPPFQGNSDAIMRRMHLTMPAPAPSSFNPQIPPLIDKVILRALAKHPEERFESVAAFATALEQSVR